MTVTAITATAIITGIGCSLLASFIFLFLILFFLRPTIRISPYVSRQMDEEKGQIKFVFKIVNKSIFSVFDIRAELAELEKLPVEGPNMNIRIKKLKLVHDGRVEYMPRFKSKKRCKPYALHAIRFNSFDLEIDNILKDHTKSLQFSITARHGLTGLGNHFKQEFANGDVLRMTGFKFGSSLDVVV